MAHLVPLSLCWHDGEIVVATEARSRTARNAAASGQARLALGSTRDVVSIEATVTVVARADASPALVDAYRARTGWEPGGDGGEWVYLRCRPVRVQVWRDVEEITGRTVTGPGCVARVTLPGRRPATASHMTKNGCGAAATVAEANECS